MSPIASMSNAAPLLMIPGPVEVSPAVRQAAEGPPPGHLAPRLIEAFGASLTRMREVWLADATSQPFVVTGGGTLAMEMAVAKESMRPEIVDPSFAITMKTSPGIPSSNRPTVMYPLQPLTENLWVHA